MPDTTDTTDNSDAESNVVPMRYPNRFRKGDGRDRRRGINKHTRILKDAIMLAAEIEGQDGEGTGKLVGFMRKVAQQDLRAFCMLLGRVIPLQVEAKTLDEDKPKRTTYRSVEEVKRELASRGISMDIMFKIMENDPEPMREPEPLDIEEDDDDAEPDAG